MGVIPPWSDLPQELLSAIAELLNTNPIDILSFRIVCKSWCSSSSFSLSSSSPTLSPPLPLTIPSPPYSLRQSSYCLNPSFSLLSVTVIYALRPPIDEDFPFWMPRVWVLFLDQSVPGKVSIRQPFSKNSYSLPINFPRTLNLLDFHASELGRFYNCSYVTNKVSNLIKQDGFRVVHKVVLFSNSNGLVVVVVLSEEGKLGLFRLGSGVKVDDVGVQTQWEIIHDGKGFRFDDIVEFKGRVLGIDRRGRVYEIVIGNCSSTKLNVVVPPIAGGGGRRKRVVESLGRLHLVVRCTVRGENDALFKVYELNEGTKKWVEIKSIGDQTFFFGTEFSFSAAAELLHGSYGKNYILFKQNSFMNYRGYDDNFALFRKSEINKLRIGVWHLEDGSHLSLIGSHPGYSNLLWPPPSWIWTKDKFERLGTLLTALDQLQSRIPGGDKDKFNELSLMDQVGALKLMREALKIMKETFKLKELLYGFSQLQQHKKSINLHNQEGTSTLATEERPASTDSDCNWFSVETNFNACILQFEENTSNLEDALNKKKYCAAAE